MADPLAAAGPSMLLLARRSVNAAAHSRMADQSAWATLTARLTSARENPATDIELAERADGLAAALADRAEVGGVETRDASTGLIHAPSELSAAPASAGRDATLAAGWSAPTHEHCLVIYTTPDDLPAVERALEHLCALFSLAAHTSSTVHRGEGADDWRDEWKRHYKRQYFAGGRLLLRPTWLERQPEDPELEVRLDPGRAFGTGLHETTRLCLEAAARHCLAVVQPSDAAAQTRARSPIESILDLGCGSGILGIACLRILDGRASCHFADIENEAVEATRENLCENHLDDARVQLTCGTLADLGSGPFDLVLANIRPEVLIPSAADIAQAVVPGGTLILGGILQEEAAKVNASYIGTGHELTLESREALGDWVSLTYQRTRD